MEYIVTKRCKQKVLGGDVNLPYGTICRTYKDLIIWEDKPICMITSEVAHKHFARNDDSQGLKRGELVNKIALLTENDSNAPSRAFTDVRGQRWQKIWDDSLCAKFRRVEHEDVWLWNHGFYNASIEDLTYIYNLIKNI